MTRNTSTSLDSELLESYKKLIDDAEIKHFSAYACIRRSLSKSGRTIDLGAVRSHAREAVGVERERAEFGRYVKLLVGDRKICERCGGLGGSRAWPGYTCFDCAGRGHVMDEEAGL